MMFLGRGKRHVLARPISMVAVIVGLVSAATPTTRATDDQAQRALMTAHGLLERGLHELAAAEYESYLQLEPDGDDAATARYGLAVCRFHLEQWAGTVEALDGVPRDASFAFAGDALLIGGHALLRQGDAAGAAERFEELLKNVPNHASAGEAAAVRVEALQRAGDAVGASKAFEDLEGRWANEPLLPRAAFFAGQADLSRGDLPKAAHRFAQCAERGDPALAARATLMQGRCLEGAGDRAGALRAFGAARDALRDDVALQREAMVGQARLLYADGKLDAAAEALDASLNGEPSDELAAHAGLLRARVHLDQGQPAQASKLLAPLIQSGPEAMRDDATFWAAKCALRADKPDVAAALLAQGVKGFADSELAAEMQYDLGIALTRANQTEAAEQALAGFVRAHAQHALAVDAFSTLASLQHNRGAYQESLESCDLAIRQLRDGDRLLMLQLLRAESLLMLGQHDAAAQAFAEVRSASKDPATTQRAAFRGAQALARSGAFAEARPLFTSVLNGKNTQPEFVAAAFELGDGLFDAAAHAEAEQAFALFLQLAPEDESADDALIKMGLAQSRLGRPADAMKTFERLLAEHPASPHAIHARFERGQALAALDRTDDAARAFEEVVEASPDSRFAPFAMRDLGALAQQQGDYEAARRWFERAADTGVEAIAGESRFEQARSLLAAGRFAEAAPAFKALLDTGSPAQRIESAAQLGLALSRLGQCDAALQHLDSALSALGALAPALRESTMYERAWCLRELGRPEAIEAYQALLALEPSAMVRGHALLDCSALLMDKGALAEAEALLREASALTTSAAVDLPKSVAEQVAYRQGVCAYKLERFEQAQASLDGFRERFPDSTVRASAELIRGESLVRLHRHTDAAPMFATAAQDETCRAQDKQAALLRLGETCATLQRWSDSRDAFERYLEEFASEPLWFQASFGRAWAMEHAGHLDEAIPAYRAVVDKHEGETAARAQFQIGQCHFAKGALDDAVRELLRVDILYAYPQWSAAALHEAGKCFEQMKQTGDARAQYEAVVQRFADTSWARSARERLDAIDRAVPPGRSRTGGE